MGLLGLRGRRLGVRLGLEAVGLASGLVFGPVDLPFGTGEGYVFGHEHELAQK